MTPADPAPAPSAVRAPVPPAWLVALAVVVGALVTWDVLAGGVITGWDHGLSHLMRRWDVRDDPWPMRFTYLLTLGGQRGSVLVLTVPLVAYLVWRGRSVEPALRFVLALLLLTVCVYALKDLTARTAPPVDGLHTATGASFPSGHVANAILVWGTVGFAATRVVGVPTWLPRVLRVVGVAAPVAVVVGMTILDYHWLSDFVVGACLAVVLLRVCELPGWSRPVPRLDRLLRLR